MSTATMSGAGADIFTPDDVAFENGRAWSAGSRLQKSPTFDLKFSRQKVLIGAAVVLVVLWLAHNNLGRRRR